MDCQDGLRDKSAMQQKAIQKFPFNINNQTYFSSQCYFENTIINGVLLQLKQGKGITNQANSVDYLYHSNRLVFYAGCNILLYNSYKRKYDIISQTNNLVCLKATSLGTGEKEYVLWMEKDLCDDDEDKFAYVIFVYDVNSKRKIYEERFSSVNRQLKPGDNIEIIAFMHPFKVLGFVHLDQLNNQTCIGFKKMLRPSEQVEFGPQTYLTFSYQIKNIKYDFQSNSYFFMKNEQQIWSIRCVKQKVNEQDGFEVFDKNQCKKLYLGKIMSLSSKKKGERKIIHFAISQLYLILLTSRKNEQRQLEVYSLFSYIFIFSQCVWHHQADIISEIKPMSKINLQDEQKIDQISPIDKIQFNKNVIIGIRQSTTQISIFNLSENQIKHVKDTTLNLNNCYSLEKIFINPFSSEVLVLSRHYLLEGTFTTSHKSAKLIRKSEMRYKNFFLEVSSFFITVQANYVDVDKMGLQRRNYCCVLTAPWMTEFLIQTDNSVKSRKWEQKFDAQIKCSALHPTSQYIALGFNDSFKIYYLTYQGLAHSCVTQNVKECISLSYSRLGHDFAVATCTNILIYNSYNYEKKFQISLGMSYRIEEISYIEGWCNNKSKECLQCVTNTKRIVVYNVFQNYNQQFSFNPKNHLQKNIFDGIMSMMQNKMRLFKKPSLPDQFGTNAIACPEINISLQNASTVSNSSKKGFSAVFYDEKVGIVIFSLAAKLYFISTLNFQSLGCYDFQEVSCMELCRSLNTLFMGTASGNIIAFPWPNKPINITSKIPTYSAHRSRVKKIKITSNLFQLVSITDESIYVHSLTFVHEMRKVQKYELQREYNPKSLLAIDFFMKMGYCLFTVQKYEQKSESIKQIQQQAINVNFMLPEQREKQKMTVMNKLETQKNKVAFNTQSEMVPLKIESMNIKNKIKSMQKQLKLHYVDFEQKKQKEIEQYQKKISQFSLQKQQLRNKHSDAAKRLQQEMKQAKQEIKREEVRIQTIYRLKLQQMSRQVKDASFESEKNAANFHQLSEMDEEKKTLSQVIIKDIQTQINVLLQRNGYLSCRNSNIQKDINTKKRKIDDIKQLIQNTERSIKNMASKNRITLKPEQMKEQNQINKQFSDTEKRYLKQTKKLIEKNKAINVSIQLYEREREMLVVLEEKLQKAQGNIEQLLSYIMNEREQKRKIKDKLSTIKQKAMKISQYYQYRNAERIKMKNTLNEYIYQLTMFQQGVIDLQQLKKYSQIKDHEQVHTPRNINLDIEQKKRKINKIESAEQKVKNVMKNERKIYSNEKKKSSLQNQDLLVNFNFLLHENKELINKMKDQQQRKNCLKSLSSRREIRTKKLQTKPTPFQAYIKMKTTRRLKTTPCAQYSVSQF